MITTLIVLCLPAFAPVQDDPARAALQRIEVVLGRAKTITLRSQTEIKAMDEAVRITATVLFKGPRASITGTQKSDKSEESFATLIDDGTLHVQFAGQQQAPVPLPQEYLAELQLLLVRAGVFPLSTLTHPKVARERVGTPGKLIEISELKLADDSRSLTYTLRFLGTHLLDAFGGTCSCALRFDPDSGKPTGRTLTASTPDGKKVSITETYELTLDAEIPDGSFKMPERKAAARNGFKPTECISTQCPVDLADARKGRWMTYLMKTSVSETRYSLRVVGRIDADWLIESWFETDTMKYAWLYRVGADRQIRKAWAAAEVDSAWTPVPVKEAPKPVTPDSPKVDSKESEEKKQVHGGAFDCKRIDATLTIGGREYKSSSWYSKDVWRFVPGKDQPGGLVAMESGDASTALDAKGEDALPTIPLPKE